MVGLAPGDNKLIKETYPFLPNFIFKICSPNLNFFLQKTYSDYNGINSAPGFRNTCSVDCFIKQDKFTINLKFVKKLSWMEQS